MANLLLDTCALIWIVQGDALARPAMDALRAARMANAPVAVSPISAWELGLLVSRGRVTASVSPQAWFRLALQKPGVALAAMPPELLIASSFLPGDPPRDPGDRIVAATAREYGLSVMTRDRELLAYAAQGHIDAVPC